MSVIIRPFGVVVCVTKLVNVVLFYETWKAIKHDIFFVRVQNVQWLREGGSNVLNKLSFSHIEVGYSNIISKRRIRKGQANCNINRIPWVL